jgi:acyl-CoA synthetase (AMP-forming)/AMP-acid ligase II
VQDAIFDSETSARAAEYRRRGWWPGESLAARYAQIVKANPDAPAIADAHGRTLSHRELWDAAGEWAEDFARHGAGAGDVVAIILPNQIEWQVAFLAALRVGAVAASLPATTDADTLADAFATSAPRIIVAAEEHRGHPAAEAARDAAATSGCDAGVLALVAGGARRWYDAPQGERLEQRVPDTIDHIMFTSSTTGRPKAVMHTADTLAALNIGFTERYGLGPDTPIFMPSPLGHSVGAIHGARLALFTGAPLVVQDRWDPEEALRLSAAHRCAFTAAATPFLTDLVDADPPAGAPKLANMRTFLCGGAPVPPALLDRTRHEFPETFVTVLWGMTEGGVTSCPPDDPPERVASTAGAPLPGLELRIVEEGELAMRGPGVFVGYLGQDELYQSLLTPDGFFRTGDLAEVDGEGYLLLRGRLKDLIVRGGVNISPARLEDCLAGHPAVREIAVIGTPDDRLGERICAVIVADHVAPALDELVAWAREHGVPQRQWPERLEVVESMPRTPAGKIRKPDLRTRIAEAHP